MSTIIFYYRNSCRNSYRMAQCNSKIGKAAGNPSCRNIEKETDIKMLRREMELTANNVVKTMRRATVIMPNSYA